MPRRVVAASQDSLARQMLWRILIVASAASVAFATVFVALYLDQLKATRADASLNLNRVLEAAWENAMLKRDVEGLRDIVSRLGAVHDIRDVLVLAPSGEVRFASNPARLGQQLPELVATASAGVATSRFEQGITGEEVLRSINPVSNHAACAPCHGPVSSTPVNGVLVIDYDATPVRRQALASTALLTAAGGLVIVLTSARSNARRHPPQRSVRASVSALSRRFCCARASALVVMLPSFVGRARRAPPP